MSSIVAALTLYRQGRVDEAEAACEAILGASSQTADALELLAEIRLATGRGEAAIAPLTALGDLRPTDAANQRRLGGALYGAGRARDAVDVLRRAIELEPDSPRAHNALGQALLQLNAFGEAIESFEHAVALNSDYAIARNNLGLALTAAGKLETALEVFRRVIATDAGMVVARVNLAITLDKLERLTEALLVLDQALEIFPGRAEVLAARGTVLSKLNRLGAALDDFDRALESRPRDVTVWVRKSSVLLSLQRPAEALRCAEQALQIQGDLVEAINAKGGALCKLNRSDEALVCFDRALELNPAYAEVWRNRAVAFLHRGDHESAAASYRCALEIEPDCALSRTGVLSALIPSVPLSEQESRAARSAFDTALTGFEEWITRRKMTTDDALTIAQQEFFYLSYQEESNRTLLERYRCAAAARLSGFIQRRQHPSIVGAWPRRLRLGFVSAHVRDHSVYHALLHGWLKRLDSDTFEITVFNVGLTHDATTLAARQWIEHDESDPRPIEGWGRLISDCELDALVYPEVGMDRVTLALASLRLAPVQLASWGHPETSGLPTIDHFLSAELLEPQDAQNHYSERLICLPHLGVYYEPFASAAATVDMALWGAVQGPLFVCPGSPFKYRPQDDHVFVDIALRLGRCTFVFFKIGRVELSNRLQERLAGAFRRAGLDPDQFLVWVPWMPRSAFLALMRQADVYLDTIAFSGFNTVMQAVEANLPCVTHQGRFLRGRLGSGIFARLGLTECVASNSADYVETAVKIAGNAAEAKRLRETMRQAEPLLYEDTAAIAALSETLLGSWGR